jgi:hypothetical protein
VDQDAGVTGNLTVGGQITAGAEAHILTNQAGLLYGGKLQPGTVDSSQLATGAVTWSKLADGAVIETKITNNAVTTSKIALGAVGNSQLAANAVTYSKIADNSIGSLKILDGTVTGADVQYASLTGTNMQDGSIAAIDLASSAVTSAKLADGAVSESKIASNAVSTIKIVDAAVTPAKLNQTQTYIVPKLGINTDVPQGGIGTCKLAVHGTANSLDCANVQFTSTQDAYPVMCITPSSHNNIGIRWDCYWGPNEGYGLHRSGWQSSNAMMAKWSDVLYLYYNSAVAQGQPFQYFTIGFQMSCTDGSIKLPQVYDDQVGGNHRQLYIDDTGKLGYVSSSIATKENVRDTTEQDTSFIYSLRPVIFDYKEPELGTNECGLIAEEVDTVCPRIVGYKREVTITAPSDPNDTCAAPTTVVTKTNIPETVNYNELTVPMLAEMQRLKKRVDQLEGRLAALEPKK